MIHAVRAASLALLFALSTAARAPAAPVAEPPSAAVGQTGPEGKPDTNSSDTEPSDAGQTKPSDSSAAGALPGGSGQEATSPAEQLHMIIDFEIDVIAQQHEPAGESLDDFGSKLKFAAVLPFGATASQPWSGYGEMSYKMQNRAPQSFQAPHRPLKNFPVHADSTWNRGSNTVSVTVHPEDAVTYSLTTGEVLGTVGILELMLADAKAAGLAGTVLDFSIPVDTPVPAEFIAKFDTSSKHVCWFDGEATVRVLARRIGRSVALSEEEAKQLGIEMPPKAPSAGQPEPEQETREPLATPGTSADEQPESAAKGAATPNVTN